jgi:hypothetical protein
LQREPGITSDAGDWHENLSACSQKIDVRDTKDTKT